MERSEVSAPTRASASSSQDNKFSRKLLAKGFSEENPGMPSPTSTRGGSKGLALEGLAMSTGQHWPQHKDMCAFLKGKGKKKSFLTLFPDPLHKRSWSKDVLFRDVTEERHPSNVSSLACPQRAGTSFFLSRLQSISPRVRWVLVCRLHCLQTHLSSPSAVKSALGHSCTVPVLSLYYRFEP